MVLTGFIHLLLCGTMFLVTLKPATAYGHSVACSLNPRPCPPCTSWICGYNGVGQCLPRSGCSTITKDYPSNVSHLALDERFNIEHTQTIVSSDRPEIVSKTWTINTAS